MCLCLCVAVGTTNLFQDFINRILVDLQCLLVSGVQQSELVMYTYIYILYQILFHYRLLQDTEYSVIVGLCCVSLFYICMHP